MENMTLIYIAGIALAVMLVARMVLKPVEARNMAEGRPTELTGPATIDDVHRLIRQGHKIHAIKAYRELHQVGLKEAKEAVEKLGA